MDKLQAMQVFTRVVETSSFSRAADALRLPRASVTRLIQELEAHLRIRLLNRTTRSLSVTVEGAAYYQRCAQILLEIDAAEGELGLTANAPSGEIRVDMPGWIGSEFVLPALQAFHDNYPNISLILGFSDRLVDLVQEGVDCAVRIGELPNSSLVARRVGMTRLVTVVAEDYIRRHGSPRTIAELSDHQLVGYLSSRTGRTLLPTFEVSGKTIPVKMQAPISTNEVHAYLQCARMGFGVAQVPEMLARPLISAGDLIELFPEHQPAPLPISLLFPHNRHVSPQVRAFANWISELFAPPNRASHRPSVLEVQTGRAAA
ncbi:LysR family transcriptional regulator [Cupriavidus pauculus]|uniref:LysR family transcriptional regulator n=1 Tax=Cupriavidus pauculus TaxID=82633 RepID=UPI001FD327BA|nr:LysR family transcriptional regulator [Cupriavidus pauculus]